MSKKQWYEVIVDVAYEGEILDKNNVVVPWSNSEAKNILLRIVRRDVDSAFRSVGSGPVDWDVRDANPRINDFDRTWTILQAVQAERKRQEDLKKSGKFLWTCAVPTQMNFNGPNISWRGPSFERKLAVLAEEFGEVSREVTERGITMDKYERDGIPYPIHREQYYIERLKKELIEVAAVCVAWAESL